MPNWFSSCISKNVKYAHIKSIAWSLWRLRCRITPPSLSLSPTSLPPSFALRNLDQTLSGQHLRYVRNRDAYSEETTWVITALILSIDITCSDLLSGNLTKGKEPRVPTKYEAERAPLPLWTLYVISQFIPSLCWISEQNSSDVQWFSAMYITRFMSCWMH